MSEEREHASHVVDNVPVGSCMGFGSEFESDLGSSRRLPARQAGSDAVIAGSLRSLRTFIWRFWSENNVAVFSNLE